MAKRKARGGTLRAAAAQHRKMFVEAYCRNGQNGRAAYKEAGYAVGKPKTMDPAIYKLLNRPDVKAEVERRLAEAARLAEQSTNLTMEETMRSLARDIRFDPAKMLREDGTLKPIAEMDEDTRLALRGMEHFTEYAGRGEERAEVGTTAKVKFPEKTAAREQAMKHFGLYEADNRQKPAPTVNVGVLTVRPDGMHFDKVRARALMRA